MENYANGYIERKKNGRYVGEISIDGVSLGSIECVIFNEKGKAYIWLKRTPILEYDDETKSFKKRQKIPGWEVYMEKQFDKGIVAYKGEFAFLRFKYSIVGIWEKSADLNPKRINLYVERLPMSKQTIINRIKERKYDEKY